MELAAPPASRRTMSEELASDNYELRECINMLDERIKELRESRAELLAVLQDFAVAAVGHISPKDPCWARADAAMANAAKLK